MYVLQQTLDGHTSPITALDFSEPYGTLVSASQEDSQPYVWDLFSGSEIGRLRAATLGPLNACKLRTTSV